MFQNFKPHLVCNRGNRKCEDRVAVLHQTNSMLHLDFCCKLDMDTSDGIPIRWCELEEDVVR
jgi:hypothetical protein